MSLTWGNWYGKVVLVGEVKPEWYVFRREAGKIHEDIVLPQHSPDGPGARKGA